MFGKIGDLQQNCGPNSDTNTNGFTDISQEMIDLYDLPFSFLSGEELNALFPAQDQTFTINDVHICRQCNRSFRRPGDLNKHNRVKHGAYHDRKFQCKTCSKKFLYPKDLSRHAKVHLQTSEPVDGEVNQHPSGNRLESLTRGSKRFNSEESHITDSSFVRTKVPRTTNDDFTLSTFQDDDSAFFYYNTTWQKYLDGNFVAFDDIKDKLKEIDTLSKMLELLFPSLPDRPDAQVVLNGYTIVLCVLLAIRHGRAIRDFIASEISDACLPLESEPSDFPRYIRNRKDFRLYSLFDEQQWRFFPHTIRGKCTTQRFDSRVISPFTEKQLLGSSPAVEVYKVKINPSLNKIHDNPNGESPVSLTHDTHASVFRTTY